MLDDLSCLDCPIRTSSGGVCNTIGDALRPHLVVDYCCILLDTSDTNHYLFLAMPSWMQLYFTHQISQKQDRVRRLSKRIRGTHNKIRTRM